MAGFFSYLGRVFTEKGAWYKILTIAALQLIIVYFSPENMMSGLAETADFSINIPAIVLYILASCLIFGFSVQIYANSLNNRAKLLPDLDFGGMFVYTLRFIPFSIVWATYITLLCVAGAMLMPMFRGAYWLPVVIMILLFAVFILALPVLMALHSKSFSYKYVLNPLTPFRIFSRVVGPIALLDVTITLLSAVLYGLVIGGAVLIGVSGGISAGSENVGTDPVSTFTFRLLLLIFFYVQNAIGFAYSLKICDIIKSRLGETEYFDDDYDVPAEDEEADDDIDY